MRYREGETPSAWHRGDDLLEKFWVEMKRQTTIPDPMLMTAFETSSRIAEHECARHEGCSSVASPIPKRAPRDGGHTYQIVLLFERPVVGTSGTDNVIDPPAWTRR